MSVAYKSMVHMSVAYKTCPWGNFVIPLAKGKMRIPYRPVAILKSECVTPTERLLAELCDQTFLKLWSYPNPFRDDGDELCDLMVAFENELVIFFDRENHRFDSKPEHLNLAWKRWKKATIEKQISSAHGAERYIRMGRKIYLDAKKTQPFSLHIDPSKARFHKIIFAHGVRDACKESSPLNVSGSLTIYDPTPNLDGSTNSSGDEKPCLSTMKNNSSFSTTAAPGVAFTDDCYMIHMPIDYVDDQQLLTINTQATQP